MFDIREENQRANILIVDDVVPNLLVLTEMIQEAGYTARPVTSVKQAMQAVKAKIPQLILLDISMPDVDGFEWCEILKKDPLTREIPIIFISALNSIKDKIRGFKLGAVDFICKPFEAEEVSLRINTHLKVHKMQKELEMYNNKLQKLVNEQVQKIGMEQKNLIYAMARISEIKDCIRENHIENVTKNARLLAICLQLTDHYLNEVTNEFIDTIELAASLHDIGEVGVPDYILKNSNQLSEKEREILQSHTEVGARTLSGACINEVHNLVLKMAVDIAYCHHENWDGTGYPRGLEKEQIPLSARIVSIVDSYDKQMEANFQLGLDEEECHKRAMQYMTENANKKFDPVMIQLLTKVQHKLIR